MAGGGGVRDAIVTIFYLGWFVVTVLSGFLLARVLIQEFAAVFLNIDLR